MKTTNSFRNCRREWKYSMKNKAKYALMHRLLLFRNREKIICSENIRQQNIKKHFDRVKKKERKKERKKEFRDKLNVMTNKGIE